MRNTMGDLNNHLFAQLERLNDEELSGDKLAEEITRSEAITKVATAIVQNAALVVKAASIYDGMLNANTKMPKMLEG